MSKAHCETPSIRIEKYDPNHHARVLQDYRLTELQYTKTPLDAVREAETDPQKIPLVMRNEANELVGFFILHTHDGVTEYNYDPESSVLLRSYSIDKKYRRRGYAKASFEAIYRFIREELGEKITQIVLTVNIGNEAAIALYENAGFRDTGETTPGRHSMLKIFCRSVG